VSGDKNMVQYLVQVCCGSQRKKNLLKLWSNAKPKENQDKFSLKKGKRIRKMSFSKIRPNATGQRYGDSDLAPPQPRSGFGQPPPSSDPNAHLRHAVQGGPGAGGSWMGPQHPIFQSQPPSASPPSGSSGDIAPPSPAVGGFFFPVPQQHGRGVPPNPGPSGALIPEARYDPRFPGDQGPAVAAPPPATWMPSPPLRSERWEEVVLLCVKEIPTTINCSPLPHR
jgi:hypothetical protein